MTYIVCPHCEGIILKKGKRYSRAPEHAREWIKRRPPEQFR